MFYLMQQCLTASTTWCAIKHAIMCVSLFSKIAVVTTQEVLSNDLDEVNDDYDSNNGVEYDTDSENSYMYCSQKWHISGFGAT